MPPSRLGQLGLWLQRRQHGYAPHLRYTLPEDGAGPLLAVCASSDAAEAMVQIRYALCDQCPEIRFFDMSPVDGPNPSTDFQACRQALTAINPFALLLLGQEHPSALVTTAAEMGIPLIAVELQSNVTESRLNMRAAMRRELLSKMTLIYVPDQASKSSLRRQGIAANRIITTGPFTPTFSPLSCNESERAAFAELLHGRHSWFAVCVPPSEEEVLLSAHHAALRQSHLALLFFLPTDPSGIDSLVKRIEASGLNVARRDLDEDPSDDVQVFVIDSTDELGLWYRLSPVSYMGGTLSGDDRHTRHPFEPASLGSAVVHGPKINRFADSWRLLIDAAATRQLDSRSQISSVAAELSQPDIIATMANAAWQVSTEGTAVAMSVASTVLSYAQRAKS